MSVVLKKDEKVKSVVGLLSAGFNENDFINKFKEIYPNDWKKINLTYDKHVRDTKPGKIIPMPKPEQYLKNSLNVYLNKKSIK
ncbi:MAG: hypothetical protein EOO55_02350 [Hymenobacter sp.]|nr:MAG: hypothetical protein EOO55_02350 [Hymenobacter sp.]